MKSKAVTKPWKGAEAPIMGGVETLGNVYSQNAGTIQNATDQITGLLPSMIEKYQAGDAGTNAARDYNVSVLGGQYLDQGNPYLQSMIDQSGNDVRNQMQAALGTKGLTGGSSYADIISKNLAENAMGMRYNDYSNERNRMATSAGQSPSIAASDYLSVTPMLSTLDAAQTPLRAAGGYAGSLGGLLGGYQQQTQGKNTAGNIMDGVGTALQLASMFSDQRLKTDITRVGYTDSGLPIYTYRYGAQGPFQMGVMAQEVAEVQPRALGPERDGFLTVYYSEVR